MVLASVARPVFTSASSNLVNDCQASFDSPPHGRMVERNSVREGLARRQYTPPSVEKQDLYNGKTL